MKIAAWKPNSPEAFYSWLEFIKPKILHSDGVYRVFDPIPEQKEIINNILASKNNKFLHSMSLICAPRRHGKTAAILIILLYFFFTRKNFNIVLHSATEQSCRRNQYSTLVKIIRHTPLLNKSLPEQDIQQYEMHCRPLGNSIQLASQNFSASFGGKINILFADDLAAYSELSSFNALQSSLLDSENSLLLITSNVDFSGGALDLLQQEAKTDKSIYSTHKSYNLAMFLFVLALFGGLVLFALRMGQREYRTPPPMFIVGLHAIMAIIALLLLVVGYTRY